MVRLSRPYHFKFFKGCLPQILLDPLLNTLSQMFINLYWKARNDNKTPSNDYRDIKRYKDRYKHRYKESMKWKLKTLTKWHKFYNWLEYEMQLLVPTS